MYKTIIFFVLLAVMVFCTEARERCARICNRDELRKIRCVKEGKICHKISQFSLEKKNCERRSHGLPSLNPTDRSLCRNIATTLGSGECALMRKPRLTPRDCNDIRCAVHTKILMCYRSKRNNCRLLTPCEMNIKNCKRGPHNRLEWIDSRACDGLKGSGRKQKCRPVA